MKNGAHILLSRLEAAGILALYSLLGDGNSRPFDWDKMASAMSGDTALLWRFMYTGGRLSPAKAETLLGGEALEFLRDHKLCRKVKGEWTLGSVSLVTFRGVALFIERAVMPAGYFGEDTKALMALAPKVTTGKCLCLYPGSGAGVLPAIANSEVETTFALGQYNRELIQANLLLNDAQGESRFVGSVALARKDKFDLIVAAPPSVFEPGGVKMPPLIAGGADGLKYVRQVLGDAGKLLVKDGRLVMTFMWFGQADANKFRQELAAFLRRWVLEYRVIISSKHLMQPGVPMFNMLFSSAAAGKHASPNTVAKRLLAYTKAKKFEAAYLIRAAFTNCRGRASGEIIDFSDLYYGAWMF